jgi:hypothetical protein
MGGKERERVAEEREAEVELSGAWCLGFLVVATCGVRYPMCVYMPCAVLCCALLCFAVLCCAVLYCTVLCGRGCLAASRQLCGASV